MNQTSAYPLQWPEGYPRTKNRENSKFGMATDAAVVFLVNQVYLLCKPYKSGLIISSNIPVRDDGTPYREGLTRNLPDPGVAIYFTYCNEQRVFCCDHYIKPLENIIALGKTIEAIRGIERWKCSDMMNRMFTGFKQLPADETQLSPRTFWDTLGIEPTKDEAIIRNAYIKLAKECHPDLGGDKETFQKLQSAYSEALIYINGNKD